MTYGYCRVSTTDQNLDRQLAAMKEAGVLKENIFCDKASGKSFDRMAYQKLTGADGNAPILQEGDLLIVLSLDRLGRDYDQIQDEWRRITQAIGADIRVLDMPLLDTSQSSESLDRRFMASLVLDILSYVAAKEREQLLHRQRGGIEAARARGVYDKRNHKGRVRAHVDPVKFENVYQKYTASGASLESSAQSIGLSIPQTRRRFKERERVGISYNPNAIPG